MEQLCKNCGATVEQGSQFCSQCGEQNNTEAIALPTQGGLVGKIKSLSRKQKILGISAVVVVLLVITISVIVLSVTENRNKAIKEQLQDGVWGYEGEYTVFIIQFKTDGTYFAAIQLHYLDSTPTVEYTGNYKIKNGEIVITGDLAEGDAKFTYTYKSGNLKVYHGDTELDKYKV